MSTVSLSSSRPPAEQRPPRRGQGLWVGIGLLALPPGVLSSYLYAFPPRTDVGQMAASFVAYGLLGYAVSLVAFLIALLRARRRAALAVLTLIVAVLTAWSVSWLLPAFVPDSRRPTTAPITLLSLNLRHGQADPQQVWQHARTADVVVLLEFAGFDPTRVPQWSRRFPYTVGYAEPPSLSSDTAVFSRFPLHGSTQLPPTRFSQWLTQVNAPSIGTLTLMAVHPCSPLCGTGIWPREHDIVRTVADAHLNGPLIVAGDFNAVDEHLPMRQLRADGLRSATDLVGAGWLPTYPADRWFGPLLPIDHILLNDRLTATSLHRIRVAGTDHEGLVATVAGAA